MATRVGRMLRRPLYASLVRSCGLSAPLATGRPASASSASHVLCHNDSPQHTFQQLGLRNPGRFFAAEAGEASARSRVVPVTSSSQFDDLLKEAKGNKELAVVYFTAKWCGPCRHISPVVDRLSDEFDDVKFLKVDLDEPELQTTVNAAGITAVPTFHFHRAGKLLSQITGADSTKLKSMVTDLRAEGEL